MKHDTKHNLAQLYNLFYLSKYCSPDTNLFMLRAGLGHTSWDRVLRKSPDGGAPGTGFLAHNALLAGPGPTNIVKQPCGPVTTVLPNLLACSLEDHIACSLLAGSEGGRMESSANSIGREVVRGVANVVAPSCLEPATPKHTHTHKIRL